MTKKSNETGLQCSNFDSSVTTNAEKESSSTKIDRVYEWLHGGDLDVKFDPWHSPEDNKEKKHCCNPGDDEVEGFHVSKSRCMRVAGNNKNGKFGWWPQPCYKSQAYLCVKVV